MIQVAVKKTHPLLILWRFSRPHTIFATTLQVLVGAALALGSAEQVEPLSFVLIAALMILAGLGLNIYVVGINQITDVSIDRINKPNLPLASGELDTRQAIKIVALGAFLALLASFVLGQFWFFGISAILLLGTIYSVPPMRLKRFAFWSGLTIAVCRGVIFNVTAFMTWAVLFNAKIDHVSVLIALCLFMFTFVLVIGLMKDLPDYQGDKEHGIRSYAVKYGQKRAFWVGVLVLAAAYVSMIVFSVTSIELRGNPLFIAANVVSLFVLLFSSLQVKQFTQVEFAQFYKQIWILFYLGLGAFSTYSFV